MLYYQILRIMLIIWLIFIAAYGRQLQRRDVDPDPSGRHRCLHCVVDILWKNFCLFEIQALPIIALLYKCTGLGGHKCTVCVRPETQRLIVWVLLWSLDVVSLNKAHCLNPYSLWFAYIYHNVGQPKLCTVCIDFYKEI